MVLWQIPIVVDQAASTARALSFFNDPLTRTILLGAAGFAVFFVVFLVVRAFTRARRNLPSK